MGKFCKMRRLPVPLGIIHLGRLSRLQGHLVALSDALLRIMALLDTCIDKAASLTLAWLVSKRWLRSCRASSKLK